MAKSKLDRLEDQIDDLESEVEELGAEVELEVAVSETVPSLQDLLKCSRAIDKRLDKDKPVIVVKR